jgi:hypothetical protein
MRGERPCGGSGGGRGRDICEQVRDCLRPAERREEAGGRVWREGDVGGLVQTSVLNLLLRREGRRGRTYGRGKERKGYLRGLAEWVSSGGMSCAHARKRTPEQ